MKLTTRNTILNWLEVILAVTIPVVATGALLWEEIAGQQIGFDALLRVILGLVAASAIAQTLERYVTLRRIESQTHKLTEVSNLELLRSAQEAGVVGLFRRRAHQDAWIDEISRTIESTRGTLDICGVAMVEIVKQDQLRAAIVEYSEHHDVRVMLLKPDCEEANRRAMIEEPLGRTTMADIEATRQWIIWQMLENRRFRLHLYDLPPMFWLLLTDHFAFVEPYHFGRPEGLEGCIGGHVPLLKLRSQPSLGPKDPYAIYKEHFEYLWNYTRGLRVNLPIDLARAQRSTYVELENRTGRAIRMEGWELSGQESHRPFQFARNFVWPKDKKIVITQESQHYPDAHATLEADADFMGNNTILRMTNDVGTLVAEWSIPQSNGTEPS